MADTHTQCPHCGFAYAVTAEQAAAMAGRSFACTNCGRPFALSPSGAAFAQPAVTYASGTDVKPNPLAIVSMICGCLLCVPFIGIAAVITGALGMRKARDPAVTGKGLAIAGLVLGILNLLGWGAYIGLIAAIMVPSMGMARQTANQAKCASQMRAIASAVLLYGNENGGAYPESIQQIYLTQDVTPEIFVCPSSGDTKATGATPAEIAKVLTVGGHLSYVYLGAGMNQHASAKTVIAYEPLSNHGTGSHFLFGDGSVQFLLANQAGRMIRQLESGQNPPGTSNAAPATGSTPVEVEP